MDINNLISKYLKDAEMVKEFRNILDSEEKVIIIDEAGCQFSLRLGHLVAVTRNKSGNENSREILNAKRILSCRVGERLKLSYVFHHNEINAEVIWQSKNRVATIIVPKRKEIIMHLENFSLAALQ